MRLLTSKQVKDFDSRLAEAGWSVGKLVERAGAALMAELEPWIDGHTSTPKILALVGPGLNGADLLELILRCQSRPGKVAWTVVFAPSGPVPSRCHPENQSRRQRLGEHLVVSPSAIHSEGPFDLVLDGLFGVGLDRNLEGEIARLVETINASGRPIWSIDIPSGLNADTGRVMGTAVRSRRTLTLVAAKPGLLTAEGPAFSGQVKVLALGVPSESEALRRVAHSHFLFTSRQARRLLGHRPSFSSKGTFGRCQVYCGSRTYPGAGYLTTRAAFRAGAGIVRWVCDLSVAERAFHLPEHLPVDLDTPLGDDSLNDVFVIGSGFRGHHESRLLEKLIPQLIDRGSTRVCLDAEALNTLRELRRSGRLGRLPGTWILTPHPGELARMLESTTEEIQRDRSAALRHAHDLYGGVVLLKGFRTQIFDGQRERLIYAGNSALAKAGTGDVLAGFIGGLWSADPMIEPAHLAGLAAFLHGRIAQEWVRRGKDSASLFASEIIEDLPFALRKFR